MSPGAQSKCLRYDKSEMSSRLKSQNRWLKALKNSEKRVEKGIFLQGLITFPKLADQNCIKTLIFDVLKREQNVYTSRKNIFFIKIKHFLKDNKNPKHSLVVVFLN